MEEDYGSFWAVAGTTVDIELGEEKSAYREGGGGYPVYRKGGKLTPRGPAGGDGVRPTPIPEDYEVEFIDYDWRINNQPKNLRTAAR